MTHANTKKLGSSATSFAFQGFQPESQVLEAMENETRTIFKIYRHNDRRGDPASLPPLMFRVFATEFLFDFGIRLFPEGRKVLCYLNGPVIWRQDLHNDRDASTTNA